MKHFNLSHFFFILFITVSITTASAEQRSYADALSIAEQVMGKVVFSETSTNVAATRNGSPVSDLVPYYIFDKEDGNGFAIISGSSLMRPIIGYSDNTSFKTDNLPDNLQHWFEMVSDAATFLENHPEYALSTNQQVAGTTVIEPLLGNIMWDQGTPYNNLCPKVKGTRCPTGCVATAAAQCMYYWQYPTQGSGSNSYTTSAGSSLSVDFSKQSYDYSLMYDQYTTSATAAQNAEVAKLSYHAGVAVNMDYTASSSGATVYDLHRGMIKNFSYDTKTSILFREYFTLEEWEAAILNELQNSRPVLFCGVDESDGGHCFVLDGIDSDGLYHVNWGWDGQLNGYFDVTILNAEGAGTGASSNNDGFSYSQQMLVNTAPQGKLSNGRYYPTLYSYYEDETLNISTGAVSLGGKITVSSSFIANFSYFDLTGTVGLAYVQNDEIADFSKIQYYGNGKYYDFTFDDEEPLHALDSLIYGFSLDKDVSVVPTSLSEGTYKVYLAFKDAGTSEVGLIHYYAKNDSYCTCVVANGKATFTEANTDMPLSFSAWSMSSESINVYDSKTVTCNIKNADSENTFVGRFFLNLTSPSGSSTWTEADSVIKIAPNASTTLSFGSQEFSSSGSWKAQLYVFYQNIDDDLSKDKTLVDGSELTFSVTGDASTSNAVFTLTSAPSLVANENYKDSLFIGYPASFKVAITNTGEAYSGSLQIQFFKTSSSLSLLPIGTVTADFSMDANSSTEYTLTGEVVKSTSSFKASASGTSYIAKLYYVSNGKYRIMTTSSGVTNSTTVKLYSGSPTTGIEKINAQSSANEKIYNLQGQKMNNTTKAGFYVSKGKKIIIL